MDRLTGKAIDARMDAVLARAGAFFMGKSPVHQAAEEIAGRLEAAGIDYAVAGALSLGYHGFERTTEDVDVLITPEGLERFKAEWLGRGYMNVRAGGKPVRDTVNNVRIDFLLAGEFPGDGKPKPVVLPIPGEAAERGERFRVVTLPKLIELKLASGMSAPHRARDLVDIQDLIHRAKLPKDLIEQLNPYVQAKFAELWVLAQVPDDEY
jgi:hypothetical protein